jgi:hypothetical protein
MGAFLYVCCSRVIDIEEAVFAPLEIVELVGAELVECPQPVVARKRLMTSVLNADG